MCIATEGEKEETGKIAAYEKYQYSIWVMARRNEVAACTARLGGRGLKMESGRKMFRYFMGCGNLVR
jgi:hypothetical protein